MSRIPASHVPIMYLTRPVFILPVALVLFLALGLGPNYPLALLACVVLIVGVFALWRREEPPILLFLFLMQWLQVALSTFYANMRGLALAESDMWYPGIEYASMLALFSLAFLSVGIRFGAGPQRQHYIDAARSLLARQPQGRWLRLHIGAWGISTLALVLARYIPGLSQPLLALADMKWGTFLIFSIATFVRPDSSRALWFVVFAVEFILSLGGFFSSFKFVFLYTLIALGTVNFKLTAARVLSGVFGAVMMLIAALYWTAIKPDYRSFVSGDTASQEVVVSRVEAIQKIVELASEVKSEDLVLAADQLSKRLAEIDVFSAVVENVPDIIPHEWGTLWADAISRPFMPRLFFPNKPIIDESELTNKYSGLGIAGREEGTQVSMGYIADSYIDFGEYGMMGIIFAFGYFLGRVYGWLVNHRFAYGLLGFAMASATLMQTAQIGASSAKLVGGIVVCILVYWTVLNLIVPRCLPWLRE